VREISCEWMFTVIKIDDRSYDNIITLKMHVPRLSRPACITSNEVYRERKIVAGVSWSLWAENYCFYKKIAPTITLSCNYR